MKIIGSVALGLALTAGAVSGQQRIDQTKAAPATGTVEVENLAGSVKVTGWNRAEVSVTGTLGREAERLDFDQAGSTTRIKVVLPRGSHRHIDGSELEIRIPAASGLRVETVSADIDVGAVAGALDLESVSGDIGVSGDSKEVRIHSVSGEVEVSAPTDELRAQTVSGGLTIRNARGLVEAETVSGELDVAGDRFREGRFKSVAGQVRFEGALAPDGRFSFESFSGGVELLLPANVDASFEVHTFSGSIDTDFGAEVQRTSRYTPEKETSFTVGSGGARVTVKSFSGEVEIRRR